MEKNKNRVLYQIKPSDLANTIVTKSNPNKNYFWTTNNSPKKVIKNRS